MIVVGVLCPRGPDAQAADTRSPTPPATVASTTTTSSTSSTIPFEVLCEADIRLYDPIALSRLQLDFGAYYGAGNCQSTIPGVTVSVVSPNSTELVLEGFPAGFRGPATLLSCRGFIYHDSVPLSPGQVRIYVGEASGSDGPLAEPPAVCTERTECFRRRMDDLFRVDICGDANGDGAIRAIDALVILRAAVFSEECRPTACDADRDGTSSTTDALTVLRSAVGIHASLFCPAPCMPPSNP